MEKIEEKAEQFRGTYDSIRQQVQKRMVGLDDVIDRVLAALFLGGHVLLEGVPGLGKTLLVRSLAESVDLTFSRIQFTPDLMPADIIGTNMIVQDAEGHRAFRFQKGPLFTHVLLADEINRATPKTQSALLEAMQERRVSIDGETRVLEEPFFVVATQNPEEVYGTYPLPESQLDRFLLRLRLGYPARDVERAVIARRRTGDAIEALEPVATREEIARAQAEVERIRTADPLLDYVHEIIV